MQGMTMQQLNPAAAQQAATPSFWDQLTGADTAKGLHGLASNPLFNIGMGMLRSRYDANVNPFEAISGGLLASLKQQRTEEQREMDAETRKKLFEAISGLQNQAQQGQRPQLTPPTYQDIQQGRIDALAGDPFNTRMSFEPGQAPQASFSPQMYQTPRFAGESDDLNRFMDQEAIRMALGIKNM